MEKGFGRPVFAIGVNHFRREGEQDQVLLELIWVWVLDDGEGFGHGECFTVGCVLNGEGSGDREKHKSFMRRVYILIDGEYIYLIKRKKIRLKKMMMWKIVVLAEASVLYIYIDYTLPTCGLPLI